MGLVKIMAATGAGMDAAPVRVDVANFLRPGTLNLPVLPPLTLYVHFPWCVRKCPYCDFNSHEVTGAIEALPEANYLAVLRADLEAALPMIWGRPVASVFIGGGTPSLLSARGLDQLLSDLRALLPLAPGCEITLEANPGTFEAEKFASFRASGVNRLSLGIQSFDDRKLSALGRIHDRAQALAAIEHAQREFDNFNLDLMYALPEQTLGEAQAEIEQALSLAPPHLSLYQLTLEANTVFAKHPPALPDEDAAAGMHEWIEGRMATAGFENYEVSAYARVARRCRHNLNYWQFGDYLGIGAGAHSKISFPHRVVRQVRFKQPASYLARGARNDFVAEQAEVPRGELPFEFMLNALRLNEGFAAGLFAARTGLPISQIEAPLAAAEQRGLIERDVHRIRPTELGRRFLSDLQAIFLKDVATK